MLCSIEENIVLGIAAIWNSEAIDVCSETKTFLVQTKKSKSSREVYYWELEGCQSINLSNARLPNGAFGLGIQEYINKEMP